MRHRFLLLFTLILAGLFLIGNSDAEARYWHKKKAKKEASEKNGKPKSKKKKAFSKVIKDFKKVEGLFEFYIDTTTNKVLMAVKPDQLERMYLCGITRSAGDGSFFDSGAQIGSFPFMLKRIGEKIIFMEINLRFRADSTSAISRALKRGISNSIFGSTKIESAPNDSGAFLIDPTGILVTDISNVGYFLGRQGKTSYRFDKGNSYFGIIKSFPENSEIDVILHYATDKPNSAITLASPYSMFLTYHYSFSTLPETGYTPRFADDRVGYFMTQYQDYTNLDVEEPFVRYINRWRLEKKDPSAAVSEPVEPIVYWIENTVPEEYREAVKRGIEFWNPAFEKAGFKNAIVVKQMPDDAEWDPADVRYSVVRWMIMPGAGYAVGPSRANPFTGQIYDADVRVSSDFIRHMFTYADRFIEPLSFGMEQDKPPLNPGDNYLRGHWQPLCTYGMESARTAAEGMVMLEARNGFAGKSALTKKFVNQYLTELIAHEIGHTLGLRHNFKASTAFSREQQLDPSFTAQNAVTNTVMEYSPPNIAPEGVQQGDFYSTVPGPYDNWAIEYGYKVINAASPEAELAQLEQIASRAAEPWLAYGTDEDCFGNSPRAIDPYATIFDLGSDPMVYWSDRIDLSNELWSKIETEFEKPDASYTKLRKVFGYGWSAFSSGGYNVSRFIGGIRHYRDHVDDPDGRAPFDPIPAAKQRQAMQYLRNKIWADGVFDFSPELLRKLQPERLPDFNWSVYRMQRLEYPIYSKILATQAAPLSYLYNPITLNRIHDIEMLYGKGEDVYQMSEIFQDIRRAIWTEIVGAGNISTARRNLQRRHLDIIVDLVTNTKLRVPDDAVTLARVDMKVLKGAIGKALRNGNLNTITRGHLEDSLARINAALSASLNLKI